MRALCLLVSFVVVLGVVLGCGPTIGNFDYSKEPDPRRNELVLGVGDVVGVNVWENPQLTVDATIRPDGTITMPLVGDLHAAGNTPTKLKEMITAQLANFIKQAVVTVAVRAWKSYRFTVEGEVTKPGVFSSDQYVTVSEALAMASGLTRFAKRGEIKLLRRDGKTGDVRQIPLDFDDLASGRRLDMNVYVLPGDSIYVP